MNLVRAVEEAIGRASGRRFEIVAERSIGGGCINDSFVVEGREERYFVKANAASKRDLFAAEADGLRALAATRTVRVPSVVALGEGEGRAFLVLEYLPLGGRADYRALAAALAALHAVTGERFGWSRDNYIGASAQANAPDEDWPRFFASQRLRPQLEWAGEHGQRALADEGLQLAERVGEFFTGYRPVPSLLHGDLWGGNAGFLSDAMPVIFDPATYHGDREAEIAMTELFGGFPARFYDAYRAVWPLDTGYAVRRDLYNLYHVLNHLNLFGGGYANQARQMVARLLAEIGLNRA